MSIDRVLDEVQTMHGEMTKGFLDQSNRLTAIETKIEPLFDNGQPGTLTKLENDVGNLKLSQARQFGWLAGALAVIEIIWHYLTYKGFILASYFRL